MHKAGWHIARHGHSYTKLWHWHAIVLERSSSLLLLHGCGITYKRCSCREQWLNLNEVRHWGNVLKNAVYLIVFFFPEHLSDSLLV